MLAPGAFFVLAMLIAIQNAYKEARRKKGLKVKEASGCFGDCASCGEGVCAVSDEKKIFTAGTDDKEA